MFRNGAARHRRRVVIIGGGFGGVEAARKLKQADVDVTLVDRHNHLLLVRSRKPNARLIRPLRDEWLSFVVVGGGPTGVEISGQLAILARHTMKGTSGGSTRARRE